MKMFNYLLLVLSVYLVSINIHAHQLSTSYISLETQNSLLTSNEPSYNGAWQIQLADLEQFIAFDLNGDGGIAWHEVNAKRDEINAFILANLMAFTSDQPNSTKQCSLQSQHPLQLDHHFNQPYLVVPLAFNCSTNHPLTLQYKAFFDIDANHKAIVTINQLTRVYSKNNAVQLFDFTTTSYLETFIQYTHQGILHIWLGLDHILFLIALLLTCVLVRKSDKWHGANSKVLIFKHTAWIITAFTLAHSLTLTATAMALLSPDSRWVELGIAISVLFAALNNIWPLVVRLGWVTFAFGLLHGMGFASVLGELGLSSDYQLLSVLAFNFGVEIGQLAILLLVLPTLIWARNHNWYQQWVMPASSFAIALIAVQWSIERL